MLAYWPIATLDDALGPSVMVGGALADARTDRNGRQRRPASARASIPVRPTSWRCSVLVNKAQRAMACLVSRGRLDQYFG
jgi:hypothetical protein